MDVSCNCFGVATAARVPVKRYNLLVPAIFPVTEPNVHKPVNIGVEKNIKRLSDYLERNEHRIPKVSRRLARTLHSDLRKRKYGYVKVAAAAFHGLIQACDSRFARLYAQDLLVKYPKKKSFFSGGQPQVGNEVCTGSVVGALLSSSDLHAQKWGIDLLLSMIKIQDSAEFVVQLDALVPLVCKIAVPTRDTYPAGQQTGDKIQLMNTVSAAALQALLEHLKLCSRISYAERHLDKITNTVLEIIDSEGEESVRAYEISRQVSSKEHATLIPNLTIGARIGSSPPYQAAVLILKEIGAFTQDSVEGRNVTMYWLEFIEQNPSRWQGSAALEIGLRILRDSCNMEHQRYMLASILARHLVWSSSQSTENKAALINIVLDEASFLGPTSAASLLLLVMELMVGQFNVDQVIETAQVHGVPPSLLGLEDNAGPKPWIVSVHDAVAILATKTNSRLQISSTIETALSHLETKAPLIALFLCEAAATAYLNIPAGYSPECNVTESMVNAFHDIIPNTSDGKSIDVERYKMEKSLNILRLTFEATSPGSLTSSRCAMALMALLWKMLHSPCATPNIFVSIQGVYRALTETKLTQEGKHVAASFLVALNEEIARAVSGKPSAFFASAGPVQITAAAYIANGMWECLNIILMGDQSSTLANLKPDIPFHLLSDDQDQPLELGPIGMAHIPENQISRADLIFGTISSFNGVEQPEPTMNGQLSFGRASSSSPLPPGPAGLVMHVPGSPKPSSFGLFKHEPTGKNDTSPGVAPPSAAYTRLQDILGSSFSRQHHSWNRTLAAWSAHPKPLEHHTDRSMGPLHQRTAPPKSASFFSVLEQAEAEIQTATMRQSPKLSAAASRTIGLADDQAMPAPDSLQADTILSQLTTILALE
eukprot:jgi/Picsp_1/1200/NSC_04681-R1_cyclin-like protein